MSSSKSKDTPAEYRTVARGTILLHGRLGYSPQGVVRQGDLVLFQLHLCEVIGYTRSGKVFLRHVWEKEDRIFSVSTAWRTLVLFHSCLLAPLHPVAEVDRQCAYAINKLIDWRHNPTTLEHSMLRNAEQWDEYQQNHNMLRDMRSAAEADDWFEDSIAGESVQAHVNFLLDTAAVQWLQRHFVDDPKRRQRKKANT